MSDQLMKEKKKSLLELFRDSEYVPMKFKELAVLLDVKKQQRDEFREVLDALVSDGELRISKKGKYVLSDEVSLVGTFCGHAKGFGFVSVEGQEVDIFISPDYVNSALHGDRVAVQLLNDGKGKRPEGSITRVIERANATVVGFYQKTKGFGFVLPDNQKIAKDIFIHKGKDRGAIHGHKVVVKITDFGDEKKKPEGVIVEILGHVNDPGTDILSIVKAYGLPMDFPEEVMDEVSHAPFEIKEEETIGRKDIRDWVTVTIDGEDAKDLDDAITLTKESYGYCLGVHIADVTHYVKEGSPLDEEALKRGTSVYLVDRVIPMLPHRLSNGICSLNAGVDRLALSCIMQIGEDGSVIGHEICETVIHVDKRMTYTAVNEIITNKNEEVIQAYEGYIEFFHRMKELSEKLRQKRTARGSIDFDFPESKIILDGKGKPIEIKAYERNVATKIIEDFMLLANETVAEDYFWLELPFVYRTHDYPDPEKMKRLGTFINNFGYTIRTQQGEVHPKELQKLLQKIEGSEEEALISRLTLRSMKQAKYLPVCTGHFGLAAKYYTHFTSPIRRYPDLQIHRIIKDNLQGRLSGKRIGHYENILSGVTTQCSASERKAEEAERETIKLKKCQYMQDRIGEVYAGVISGVTTWGFYVELPNTVEGLVHVNELKGDYYEFHEASMELRGETKGKIYKLGQKIKVQVTGTDKLMKTIDFLPVEE